MPRQKYQRPEVYLAGKREKLWKAEYREYYLDAKGVEKSRHKSATWSRADHTKSQAQEKCDALMQQIREGGPRADGSVTLTAFWTQIYYPVRSRRWEWNTKKALGNVWTNHVEPDLGRLRLEDITKATIELHLGRLADRGMGETMLRMVRACLSSVLGEATENDYIRKNPARKAEVPRCQPAKETRSLTADEARRLLASTTGRDYLFWRVLVLTGARIGEVLALKREDLIGDALRIDESAVHGTLKCTKNGKSRLAPIPPSLRAELEEWLTTHDWSLVFPSLRGKVYHRQAQAIEDLLKRGRDAAGIPDLTFRMCRTTFATLFDGNIRDAQEILGHHSEQFTRQRYQRAIAERAAAAVAQMDERLGRVVEMPRKKVG
jgi:integrase